MPYQLTWRVPQRVIYEQLSGQIGIGDIQDIQDLFHQYLAQGQAPVHLIVDMREVTDYPLNLAQIKNQMITTDRTPLGWIMIVNQNPMPKFLTSVATQLSITNTRLRMVDSPEQAFALLQEYDPALQVEQSQS